MTSYDQSQPEQERYDQFLNETWKQFPPKVQEKLRRIHAECGNWAAELATEALLLQEQSYKQLQRSQENK